MSPTCYRHSDRETGVSCSACGRPICPECMTPTPVGMRCPECAGQRTRVVRAAAGGTAFERAPATVTLIAINAVAFLIEIATGSGGLSGLGGGFTERFLLFGPFVAEGEWYRLLTSGFLHAGLFHILFNMFALYVLGRLLEPSLGTPRFLLIYFASLLAGSFGVMLVSPNAAAVGASGAIFGLFGATLVIARGRGMNEIANQLGLLLVLNLVITFTVPRISIGAHLGGLVAGLLCGLIVVAGERGRLGPRRVEAELALMAAIAIAAALGAVAAA